MDRESVWINRARIHLYYDRVLTRLENLENSWNFILDLEFLV